MELDHSAETAVGVGVDSGRSRTRRDLTELDCSKEVVEDEREEKREGTNEADLRKKMMDRERWKRLCRRLGLSSECFEDYSCRRRNFAASLDYRSLFSPSHD